MHPDGRIDLDLGDSHTLTWVQYQGDERTGANVWHLKPDGSECGGWIAFAGGAWAASFAPGAIATWTVESPDPLTLSPSLLCRSCGDHGFIRAGRWVRA
jgi:hypothetical protein